MPTANAFFSSESSNVKREFPYVTLSLDEVNNAGLIGEAGHEVRALAELRKYGLALRILTQHLDFPSTKITDGVLTNCATKKYFACPEAKTAAKAGADLGGAYTTDGSATRHYRDGTTFEVPKEISTSYADEIRNLEVGQCYIRRGNQNQKTRDQDDSVERPFFLFRAGCHWSMFPSVFLVCQSDVIQAPIMFKKLYLDLSAVGVDPAATF